MRRSISESLGRQSPGTAPPFVHMVDGTVDLFPPALDLRDGPRMGRTVLRSGFRRPQDGLNCRFQREFNPPRTRNVLSSDYYSAVNHETTRLDSCPTQRYRHLGAEIRTSTTPWLATVAWNVSVKVPRSFCRQRSRTSLNTGEPQVGPLCSDRCLLFAAVKQSHRQRAVFQRPRPRPRRRC